MKKIAAILCAVIMALSLAACGSNSAQQAAKSAGQSTSSSQPKAEGKAAGQDNLLSDCYVSIMKSSRFMIRYKSTFTTEGETMDAEITTATDGKTVDTIMKAKSMNTHTIFKDNALYMLNDASKTYSKMNTSVNSSETGLTDTEGLTYIGKGTGTVNGKNLPYEEYKSGDETMRFFLDGKNLYAIVSKTKEEEMVMTVLELTGKIPAGMLSIPAGYKEGTVTTVPGGVGMTSEQLQELEDQSAN